MIVFNYFTHQLLFRTFKYAVLLSILISFIESLSHAFLLPISLTMLQHLALWAQSWQWFVCFSLPACFYSAYLVTATGFSKTQELAIMQFYVAPRVWCFRTVMLGLLMSGFMFMSLGWVIPKGQATQQTFMITMLNDIQLPKLLSGQFNHIEIGGKKMVIFKDKAKGHKLFVASGAGGQSDGAQTLISASKMHLVKQDQSLAISFVNGQSYAFDAQNYLKYAITFDDSQVPLVLTKGRVDMQLDHLTNNQLMRSDSIQANRLLAWRLHLSLTALGLTAVALIMVDYLTCRKHSSRVYIVSGLLAFAYYMSLLIVKQKAGLLPGNMVHLAYLVCHISTILLSWLLTRWTTLVRAQ